MRQENELRQRYCSGEKLCETPRQSCHFADALHCVKHPPGKMNSPQFGEVAARDDIELGVQCPKQHLDGICRQNNPKKRVAERRTSLDICREIAQIHIGDGRNHRRPYKESRRTRA